MGENQSYAKGEEECEEHRMIICLLSGSIGFVECYLHSFYIILLWMKYNSL